MIKKLIIREDELDMRRVNIDFERFKSFLVKYKFVVVAFIFLLVIGVILIPKAFAQPIKSVEIISDSADYEKKDPGAWKVDKSAKWVGKGEAEITFDVDTIRKKSNKYTDIIFVLDISGSMEGESLDRVKKDSIELINSLLEDDKNRVGLITFENDSHILSGLTNNKEDLITNVKSLKTDNGQTNYYQALVNVDTILKDYNKEDDRDLVVLFLTDGFPNKATPNEEFQYAYLKKQYPFITINGIQYNMGNTILKPVIDVTDNQFVADMETLNNVLFEASISSVVYDEFNIIDYIDTRYFYVDGKSNISVSQGTFTFDEVNQKITWDLSGMRSGKKAKMTINTKLKEEFLVEEGFYSTNAKEEVISKIEDVEDSIKSNKTPVLANNYKVIYDGNVPAGCDIEGIPNSKIMWPSEVVGISENVPKCEGYEFKGWGIATKGVNRVNDDYFVMPEEDVVIRALWSKVSLDKSVDGEVYTRISSTMEKVTFTEEEVYLGGGTWDYQKVYHSALRDSGYDIKKIVFQNQYNVMTGATDVLDLSEEKNGGIIAYIFPDAETSWKYMIYIQYDGRIVLNEDSSNLFAGLQLLEEIEGLEYLDTSNVKNMSSMFENSASIQSLNLSTFDTSSVTNMNSMFRGCRSLMELNVSKFDTSNVTDIGYMFYNCGGLINLNLKNFDTAKVTNMGEMFNGCRSLTSLDLNGFNTTRITNMRSMFSNCWSLESLYLNGYTANVTDMSYMFHNCSSLSSLDLSRLDTAKVESMSYMFEGCSGLTSIDLSNLDTSSVTSMEFMFAKCSSLTSLDINKLNTINVNTMDSIFLGCSSLTYIDLSNLNIANVTDMRDVFENCSSLTNINFGNLDTSNVTNMGGMFKGCNSLTRIDLSSFDTSKVESMSYMFKGCSGLTNIDLSVVDTTKVMNTDYMFSGCNNLTNIKFSNFDSLVSVEYMFEDCSGLTDIDLSSFDTSNVRYMAGMFKGCSALTDIDLKNFNTSNVEEMNSMFSDCSSLIRLDLSMFDTSNVYGMDYMFDGCSSLTSLDLSSFDASGTVNMNRMFSYCSNLKSVDLSNFNTSRVEDMSSMFYNCGSLTSVNFGNLDTSKVRDMSSMFNGCSSLISLNLSSFNTSNVKNMSNMFNGCSSLASLNLSNFDTSKVTEINSMFKSCSNLTTTLTLSSKMLSYDYSGMFEKAATVEGARITVNYTDVSAEVIDDYIRTKSTDSNVVKGKLVTVGS